MILIEENRKRLKLNQLVLAKPENSRMGINFLFAGNTKNYYHGSNFW